MDIMQFYTCLGLWLSIITSKLLFCSAKPTYYDLDSSDNSYERGSSSSSYDGSGAGSYAITYGKPLTSNNLDKLDTGYYYVDSGYIAPVPSRGASSSSSSSQQRSLNPYDSYGVDPILRYRRTRTKRKKLFVPNFFG
ncbi:CG12826 [Drosophila busckii]|uniref:CG12826 n=1 Tax=Drosophila busckii TaxID=30019 RepID=A0A0M4EAE1_DROBS|nr:protein transport protein SEC9 [Drosophila busckii]ALC42021.1 CG12826 [Drosophila busckii]